MPGKRWLRPHRGRVGCGRVRISRLRATAVERDRDGAPIGVHTSLVLALVALGAGFFVRILRWWWMLRALEPELRLHRCVRPFLVSIAVNNTVPLRAGDLVRAFGFADTLRSPPMRVIGTLVIERVLDMFVLLAFFFVGLHGSPLEHFPGLRDHRRGPRHAVPHGNPDPILVPNQLERLF